MTETKTLNGTQHGTMKLEEFLASTQPPLKKSIGDDEDLGFSVKDL